MYKSHLLTTSTSIRLLDIIESRDGIVRCSMRVVDLNDENLDFAAVSYTWGNPTTVHEEPMPDIDGLEFAEHADKLPFTYYSPELGPDGDKLVMVDRAKLLYYDMHRYVPREEVLWQKRTHHEIEVDGSRVPIEENLLSFFQSVLELRAATAPGPGEPESSAYRSINLPIWADALCINQADLDERAAQVKLMGHLYKSASLVLAWVGPHDRLAELAIQAMGRVLDFDATRLHAQDSSYQEQEEVTMSSVPGMTVVHWFALFSLFQRLWFRRAWVVQEAVFARDILMVCGATLQSMDFILAVAGFLEKTGIDIELCQFGHNFLTNGAVSDQSQHWEKLSLLSGQPARAANELKVTPRDALSFIIGYHHTRSRLGLCNAGLPMVTLIPDEEGEDGKTKGKSCRWDIELPKVTHLIDHDMVESFCEELGTTGFRFERRKLHLLSVLSDFRELEATDPRDKIFAFLNLAEDGLGLQPDYSADVKDVFIQATKTMIDKRIGSHLAVLSHVQDFSDTRIQGLPSWVPDFSARLGRVPFDQGGHDDRFCAGTHDNIDYDDWIIHIDLDNKLSVKGIKVDIVSMSTELNQDPVIQALRLALHSPAEYPVQVRAWRVENTGVNRSRRYIRPLQAVTRVEALWRTLIIDKLTEEDNDFGSLDSRVNIGAGFSNWILTDMLEARDLLAEWSGHCSESWAWELIQKSFATRLALWSAMYDARQLSDELQVPDLEAAIFSFREKIAKEAEKPDNDREDEEEVQDQSYRLAQEAKKEEESKNGKGEAESSEKGGNDRKSQVGGKASWETGFLPPARLLSKGFRAPAMEEDEQDDDPLGGKYKRPSMQRLTPLGRRKLRNFEKHMRNATQGRKLFMTESGLLGLGPKTLGQSSSKDEVWILMGARVPFILHHIEGSRYRVVGEAYVHGVMYGEGYDRYTGWDEFGRTDIDDIQLV
ncbi:heterokaryon incompatibility (het-6OR allele) [Fusarium pseudoanthophilum]|uniref:Heterokaryon incompatibility (Het-6OR allele) n=1 Tax=Fusarium pseudoanthophilum TaxID=48495 RepID=A0A8H5V351_9HYPO|nr:heterokaryon incompatibility (het-6OR allele) [Fusarium pseudoanthophilum]